MSDSLNNFEEILRKQINNSFEKIIKQLEKLSTSNVQHGLQFDVDFKLYLKSHKDEIETHIDSNSKIDLVKSLILEENFKSQTYNK